MAAPIRLRSATWASTFLRQDRIFQKQTPLNFQRYVKQDIENTYSVFLRRHFQTKVPKTDTTSCSRACFMNPHLGPSRTFSTARCLYSPSNDEVRRKVDRLSEKFMEARELLDDVREVIGTVYYADDMVEAKEVVEETLKDYKTLIDSLEEDQRQDVVRTIGLKMEELKAQLKMIEDDASD